MRRLKNQSPGRGEVGAHHRAGDGHFEQPEGDGAGVADDKLDLYAWNCGKDCTVMGSAGKLIPIGFIRMCRPNAVNMKMKSILLGAVLMATLVACAGTMQGTVRGTGQPVSFAYEQGMSSDSLTAEIDGEAFAGKAVMRGASTTVATIGTSTLIGSSYTGDFVATLIGNRGSTLSCQLQYADSSGYTTAGGVGVCKHSDGRVIDIVW